VKANKQDFEGKKPKQTVHDIRFELLLRRKNNPTKPNTTNANSETNTNQTQTIPTPTTTTTTTSFFTQPNKPKLASNEVDLTDD